MMKPTSIFWILVGRSGLLVGLAGLCATFGCISHREASPPANGHTAVTVQENAGDQLAVSSDGRLIVQRVSSTSFEAAANIANNGRAAALVDSRTGKVQAYFDAGSGPVMGATLVERRKLCILAVSDWGTVPRVFDMVSGQGQTRFTGGLQMWLCAVGVSPDGRFVVLGGGDMSICLWDLDDPSYFRELFRDVAGNDPATRDPVASVAFSMNGQAVKWITKGGVEQYLGVSDIIKAKAKSGPLMDYPAPLF